MILRILYDRVLTAEYQRVEFETDFGPWPSGHFAEYLHVDYANCTISELDAEKKVIKSVKVTIECI